MRCFRMFSTLTLLWILNLTGTAQSNDNRIYLYDAEHYDLAIRFNVPQKTFSGSVGFHVTILQPLSELVLSASNATLTIDSVVSGKTRLEFRHSNDHLTITMPTTLQRASRINATVYYHGVAVFGGEYEGGGVYIDSDEGKARIVTGSEPMFARTWWPCKDMPSDKATASITITVPSALTAVSNGKLTQTIRDTVAATYVWATQYPIATYLVSIAAAEYSEFSDIYKGIDGKEMPIRYYVFPEDVENAKLDFQNTSKILGFFATTFGEYPFIEEKYGYAEVIGNVTMENQTISSIEKSMITGTRQSELTLVHETAHQWWGNLITPANWKETWLNEGFASYAEALYLEHSEGRSAYDHHVIRMMAFKQGQLAGSVIGKTESSFWDSFSARVYYKGALVLHMLRSMIGDSEFFTIMKNYLVNPRLRYGNATTRDFIAECEQVHGKNLQWFFDQWVYASTDSIDRPELYYHWNTDSTSDQYQVTINLEQRTASQLLYRLPFSISVQVQDTIYRFPVIDSLAMQSFTLHVPERPTNIFIDKENAVFKIIKHRK